MKANRCSFIALSIILHRISQESLYFKILQPTHSALWPFSCKSVSSHSLEQNFGGRLKHTASTELFLLDSLVYADSLIFESSNVRIFLVISIAYNGSVKIRKKSVLFGILFACVFCYLETGYKWTIWILHQYILNLKVPCFLYWYQI